MSFSIELTLSRRERALERVVGLVGRRGYEIVGASAELVNGLMAVRLELESDRSPDLLARFLARLHEVVNVRVLNPDTSI